MCKNSFELASFSFYICGFLIFNYIQLPLYDLAIVSFCFSRILLCFGCKQGLFFYQELEDPLILIHEKKISNLNAIVKILELSLKVSGRIRELKYVKCILFDCLPLMIYLKFSAAKTSIDCF